MKLFSTFVMLTLIVGPCYREATADGGQVCVSERHGEFQVTVFTSPNPLRAGPIDVGVLVQKVETGDAVVDAKVLLELTSSDPMLPPIRAVATREGATNKLMRAALLDLPVAGQWNTRVEVTPHGESPLNLSFTVDAAPPLPAWLTIWPWFTWPLAAIALFVVHRWLVGRRQSHRLQHLPTAFHDSRIIDSHRLRVAAP